MQDATVMTTREQRQQLQLRCAIGTLAKQKAIKQVKRQIASRGEWLHAYSYRDLSLMAESYLSEHWEELAELVKPLAREIVYGQR